VIFPCIITAPRRADRQKGNVMDTPKVHTIFDPPGDEGIKFEDESLTQQHFAQEADINVIMAYYQRTGILGDPLNPGTDAPMFGDFSNVQDFQKAQNAIIEANRAFMSLPSDVREKFNNDPGKLIEFLSNEDNRDEAIKLGLVKEPPAPAAPIAVKVIPDEPKTE
jgi:phage internal scaffolding protein